MLVPAGAAAGAVPGARVPVLAATRPGVTVGTPSVARVVVAIEGVGELTGGVDEAHPASAVTTTNKTMMVLILDHKVEGSLQTAAAVPHIDQQSRIKDAVGLIISSASILILTSNVPDFVTLRIMISGCLS
jgi:hypothetical protein